MTNETKTPKSVLFEQEDNLKSVSSKYGITKEQQIQIQLRFNEIDIYEHVVSFGEKISGPCLTGLIICFGSWEIIYQPKRIALEGISKLKETEYLSSKSLQELAEALYEDGYIECPYEWIKLINMSGGHLESDLV